MLVSWAALGKILFFFVKMTWGRFCFLWCKYLWSEFVAILLKLNLYKPKLSNCSFIFRSEIKLKEPIIENQSSLWITRYFLLLPELILRQRSNNLSLSTCRVARIIQSISMIAVVMFALFVFPDCDFMWCIKRHVNLLWANRF